MRVTVFGTGYVGLVQGAVLSQANHNILCVDVDQKKINNLNSGVIPIYEPGLSQLINENRQAKRLRFTTDEKEGVRHGEIIFIAVGTPPGEDGSADLQYVRTVAESIACHMENYKIIVNKSTVPVGSADMVRAIVRKTLDGRRKDIGFDVVSNPEFLREGSAVSDCMNPCRIIIGADNRYAAERICGLYSAYSASGTQFIKMDTRSAELTKYAANGMLAAKISFMNEIAGIAEVLGADVEMIRQGIGSDPRIGFHFTNPGCGYGGSCFPKDVRALIRSAEDNGFSPQVLRAVETVNNKQKEKLFSLISRHYKGHLKGRTFALWGLSFKPDTHDMREAPSRILMERLWKDGAKVRAFDPEAADEARRIYGDSRPLALCGTKEEALRGADALVICTEWREFIDSSLETIKNNLSCPVIFDGRNIYCAKTMEEFGFIYYGIGRGHSVRNTACAANIKIGQEVPDQYIYSQRNKELPQLA